MLFNSLEFLLFSIFFFTLWPIVKKKGNSRWLFITVASLIFYGWWDWRFIFLILLSGFIDYFAGLAIRQKQLSKKVFLWISISGNLISLSIFKYSVFFAHIIEDLSQAIGIHVELSNSIPEFALILPVGISFYTFQSMSYTIDIYKGRLEPTSNPLLFFSYLSMFPQLVAGPIVRAKDFIGQLKQNRIASSLQKWNGFKLICFGLFQKTVIADNLSFLVDSAFESKSPTDGTLFWWVVMAGFSFQIYCDFSGYSLIARGLAKYMGYHFKMNFNHPYLSTSLRQYWTRWHISLSSWFRDYVYIPLGGSKYGRLRSYAALLTTMMLSGLWHGANYTFLAWAAIHSLFLIIERITKWPNRFKKLSLISVVIIFGQALIAWVYFRAENIQQANEIVIKLFSIQKTDFSFINDYLNALIYLTLAVVIEATIYLRRRYPSFIILYRQYNLDLVMVAMSILAVLFFRGEGKQFIYFQF